MEVQMAATAAQGARRPAAGRSSAPPSPDHARHSGGASAKPVPGYLRPSPGSCHHVCKYGGAHAFGEEKEQPRRAQPPPRPRRAPSATAAPAAALERQPSSRVLLGKVRSVFRRRAGDSGPGGRADQKQGSKAAEAGGAGTAKAKGGGGGVEWKDIVVVAYGRVPFPVARHGSSPGQRDEVSGGSGDAKKKGTVKGRTTTKKKASGDKAKITGERVGGAKTMSAGTAAKSLKPPPPKVTKPSALLVEKMAAAVDQETLHGSSYQTLSPSLVQSRADLLRELDEEMAHEAAASVEPERTAYSVSVDQEDYAAAAAESSRPVPAHRRAKSMMGMGGSRSVRFPFARQASKSSGGASFKVRSRSTRAAPPPEEEERPARLRSRRGEDPSGGRGIQLRIRSLRRRGVGGGGSVGGAGGFVVPAVALRHQKTLEKKKSQRLYNNLIEETAGKLVKARKSRVKALVGAFESVISKIAK